MYNELLRKLYDLKNRRAQHLQAAAEAYGKGDTEAYDKAMQDATGLNAEIERLQTLIDEAARFQDGGTPPAAPQSEPQNDTTRDLRASREYVRAFAFAVRNGITPCNAVNASNEQVKLLLDALTEAGGDPTGTDGGFLVPVDLQTRINEVRRQQVALAELFNSETTNTLTGFRVYDTKPTTGFTKVAEMGEIPKNDQPMFKRIEYKLEDYALILPVSNDLIADEAGGLIAYLGRWMGIKSVITENINLLALLNTLTGAALTAGKEIAGIKTALNKALDPTISANAAILTNQSGYDALDQLVDGNGRDLLLPDPTQPNVYRLRGKRIVMISDELLPNEADGAPVYIGDFKQFASLIRRSAMEFASTNVGGNAWNTNSTEFRAIQRQDEIKTDAGAAVKRTIALA